MTGMGVEGFPPDQQALEDIGSNPSAADSIGSVIGRRLTRRSALRGLFGAAAAGALPLAGAMRAAAEEAHSPSSSLGFRGLPQGTGPGEAVA